MEKNDSLGSDKQAFRWLGSPFTFLGLEEALSSFEKARIVIVPVPYDGTTTYRSGTREGPRAILLASRELERYDEESKTEVYKQGISTLEEIAVSVESPESMVNRVAEVGDWLFSAGKFPVLIGGEHLLSVGMIRAASVHFPHLTVLQLDAHADLRQTYQGSRYSNACVMRLVSELAQIVQVGIRSLSREEAEFIDEQSISCFYAHDLKQNSDLWEQILEQLGDHVYVTIDLDVFDPSIMPAVGTPEPGGLNWEQVTGLLKEVAKRSNIVGFDVMELSPVPSMVFPDFLAARLIYKFLSYIFMDS